jgi:hypothetical protein
LRRSGGYRVTYPDHGGEDVAALLDEPLQHVRLAGPLREGRERKREREERETVERKRERREREERESKGAGGEKVEDERVISRRRERIK